MPNHGPGTEQSGWGHRGLGQPRSAPRIRGGARPHSSRTQARTKFARCLSHSPPSCLRQEYSESIPPRAENLFHPQRPPGRHTGSEAVSLVWNSQPTSPRQNTGSFPVSRQAGAQVTTLEWTTSCYPFTDLEPKMKEEKTFFWKNWRGQAGLSVTECRVLSFWSLRSLFQRKLHYGFRSSAKPLQC